MRVYKLDNKAIIIKKTINDIPCSIWIQEDGVEGNAILLMKNNETPIISGGNEEQYEVNIVDLSFNEDLNNIFKQIILNAKKILTIDNGVIHATTWFNENFTSEDYQLIKELKELLIGVGYQDDELTLINNFLKGEK